MFLQEHLVELSSQRLKPAEFLLIDAMPKGIA